MGAQASLAVVALLGVVGGTYALYVMHVPAGLIGTSLALYALALAWPQRREL